MSLLSARPIQAERPAAGRRSDSPGTLTHVVGNSPASLLLPVGGFSAAGCAPDCGTAPVAASGGTIGTADLRCASRRGKGRDDGEAGGLGGCAAGRDGPAAGRGPVGCARSGAEALGCAVMMGIDFVVGGSSADVAHAHFEGDPRTVGLADVDRLAVVDVDDRNPLPVEVDAVQRVVVDRQPPPLIEAQQHVRAGDQRVRHAQVGPEVAAHDHVAASGETTFGPVRSSRQHGLLRSSHHIQVRSRDWGAGLAFQPDMPADEAGVADGQRREHEHVEHENVLRVLPDRVVGRDLLDLHQRREVD